MSHHHYFAEGASLSLPVAIAMLPFSLGLGLFVAKSGLPWWCAPFFAAVVFAGSLEFLLVGMVSSLTPLASIAAATFLVNLRHVFYALSFPLQQYKGIAGKFFGIYTLCDETWALTSRPEATRWPGAKLFGVQIVIYVVWILGTLAGVLVGSIIPENIEGFEFGVTAFFIVLAIDAYKERPSRKILGLSLFLAALSMEMVKDTMVALAMGIYLLILLGVYAGQYLKKKYSEKSSHISDAPQPLSASSNLPNLRTLDNSEMDS